MAQHVTSAWSRRVVCGRVHLDVVVRENGIRGGILTRFLEIDTTTAGGRRERVVYCVGVLSVEWAVWLGACKRQRKPISALPDTQLIIPSLSTSATPH